MNAHSAWIPWRGHSLIFILFCDFVSYYLLLSLFIFVTHLSYSYTFHTDINGFCKHHCQLSAGNPISHKADSYKHKNQRRPFTVPYFAGFQFIHFFIFPLLHSPAHFSTTLSTRPDCGFRSKFRLQYFRSYQQRKFPGKRRFH